MLFRFHLFYALGSRVLSERLYQENKVENNRARNLVSFSGLIAYRHVCKHIHTRTHKHAHTHLKGKHCIVCSGIASSPSEPQISYDPDLSGLLCLGGSYHIFVLSESSFKFLGEIQDVPESKIEALRLLDWNYLLRELVCIMWKGTSLKHFLRCSFVADLQAFLLLVFRRESTSNLRSTKWQSKRFSFNFALINSVFLFIKNAW